MTVADIPVEKDFCLFLKQWILDFRHKRTKAGFLIVTCNGELCKLKQQRSQTDLDINVISVSLKTLTVAFDLPNLCCK